MLNLYVGCKTEVPGVYDDMYYNIEIEAETYPSIEKRDQLKQFLNDNTSEIVDDVRYVIDKTTGELIWEVK